MSGQESLTKLAVQSLVGPNVAVQSLLDPSTGRSSRARARHELAVIQAEIRRLSRAAAPRRVAHGPDAPGGTRG